MQDQHKSYQPWESVSGPVKNSSNCGFYDRRKYQQIIASNGPHAEMTLQSCAAIFIPAETECRPAHSSNTRYLKSSAEFNKWILISFTQRFGVHSLLLFQTLSLNTLGCGVFSFSKPCSFRRNPQNNSQGSDARLRCSPAMSVHKTE